MSYKSNYVDNPAEQFYTPYNNQPGQQFQAKPFVPAQAQHTFTQGFQNKNTGYGNRGFQSKQQYGNAGSQDMVELMFHQVLEGQKMTVSDINAKNDGTYNDLNGKIES